MDIVQISSLNFLGKSQKIMIFISYQEEPTEQMKENMAALQSIFKMLKSFPAVPEDHFLQNGV